MCVPYMGRSATQYGQRFHGGLVSKSRRRAGAGSYQHWLCGAGLTQRKRNVLRKIHISTENIQRFQKEELKSQSKDRWTPG